MCLSLSRRLILTKTTQQPPPPSATKNHTTRVHSERTLHLVVRLGEDDALELGLEELHGVSLGELVGSAYLGLLLAALGDAVAGALEHHEEVHT